MEYANIGEYRVTLGFIGGIGAMELVLILLLVLVLFGARKIPELAKGLGSGMREFRKAAREVESAAGADADVGNAKAFADKHPSAPTSVNSTSADAVEAAPDRPQSPAETR